MKKLTDARNHLLQSGVGIKAKELLTFAEKGHVKSARGDGERARNRNLQIAYVAHLIVTDFAGNPADLLFVMNEWVAANCPDHEDETLKFHVDVISTKCVDVSIQIDLKETICVQPVEGGTELAFQPDADASDIDMGTFFPEME